MPTVLVVGADRGIAHALSRQLNERGDSVIAACLVGNDELAAAGVRVEGGVDVTSQPCVDALAARLTAEGVIGRPERAARPVAAGRTRPRSRRPVADLVSEQRD